MNKALTTKVIIDPRARIAYASFYIKGIQDLFGARNVSFNIAPFLDVIKKYDDSAFDQFFAFILIEKSLIKKVVVDYKDSYPINLEAYKWCDVYGKVNLNYEKTDLSVYNKLIPIGPGFGIRIWSIPMTILRAGLNFIKSFRHLDTKLYSFFYGYYWQTRRLPITEFSRAQTDGSYVFFVSTLWTQDNCVQSTNVLRADFVRVYNTLNVNFEGGLYAKPSNPEYSKYKDLVYTDFISFPTYFKKIRRSSVVFNTPSVYNCHGWKLGEFFALGKAIISTPLSNMMPVELEHGKHIHFITDSSGLKDAIQKILTDNDYRALLEKGTSEYYNNYLAPTKVIQRLVKPLSSERQ